MPSDAEQLFLEHFVRGQDKIYGYLVMLVANRSDAEELFQQTTLLLWKKWGEFDPSRDFVAWACGIAHHEVRNFLRKHERRNPHLSLQVIDEIAETCRERVGLLDERRAALAKCISHLAPRERELLDHCYIQGKTIQDLAKELERTPNSLYKALRRIRWSLYQCVNRTLSLEAR